MTTYDTDAGVVELEATQFDGTAASVTAIQAICRDARADPTLERVVIVPGFHGRKQTMNVGDWIISATAGEFLVLPDASFLALFNETEEPE